MGKRYTAGGLFPGSRTRRVLVVAGISAAALAVALPGRASASTSGTSNQSVTATVVAGTLTVTAPPALVTNLSPGVANTGIALGSLVYTNTLNDGLAWTVTVTSNDWMFSTNTIHFTGMTVTPGSTIGVGTGGVGTPTAGGGGTFTGSDATPGTTQSSPVTMATGTSTTQGVFTQNGSTLAVIVPGGTPTGAYTGTIVYTITG